MSSLSYNDFVEIRSAIHTTNVGAAIMMPVGGICMYPSDLPPTGYLLCDGAAVDIASFPSLYAVIGHTFDTGQPPVVDAFYLPDMKGRFVVGTGQNGGDTAYNIDDKGGEETHVLTTDEVGAHTHGITITDPGHTHTATATDPGHTHAITDPGHTHAITDPGHVHGGAANTLGGLYIAGAPDAGRGGNTNSATTSITIDSAPAGVSIASASIGVTVAIASEITAISATIGQTDAAGGHENRPPYIALAYIIRAI